MDDEIYHWLEIERLADSDIDRLVEYTQKEPKHGRAMLKAELEEIRIDKRIFAGPYPTPTELKVHAESVRNTTNRLLHLIDVSDPKNPWRHIISAWDMEDAGGNRRPSLGALKEGLNKLLETSESLIQPFTPGPLLADLLSSSKFETLIGQLVQIFERNFEAKATSGRRNKDQKPDTPFIRFADFTLRQLVFADCKKIYALETIVRELTRLRAADKKRRLVSGGKISQKI